MKLKQVLALVACATVLSTVACADLSSKTVKAADVQMQTSDSNEKAEMYRFLQETRATANADGQKLLFEESSKLLQSGADSEELEVALDKYLTDLGAKAADDKNKKAAQAKQDLIDFLENGQKDSEEGIKFVDQARSAELQAEFLNAVNSLSSSMKAASRDINTVAKEEVNKNNERTSTQHDPAGGVPSASNDTNESILDSEIASGSEQSWSDLDLKEIAQCEATSPNVADGSGNCNSITRSFMAYTKVTSKTSAQYALLNSNRAYTDQKTGFRMVDGRYCIAVGSGYTQKIGTKIDLVLEDGSIIKCILGDCKSDKDTDAETHTYCKWDGSVAEFIIDNAYFNTDTEHNPVNTALNKFDRIIKVVVVNG